MGGIGSGRIGYKYLVERCLALDIRSLHRNGRLSSDGYCFFRWTCNGKPLGDVRCWIEKNKISLFYKWCQGEDSWQSINETIYLAWTRCNYGGQRAWFLCPECGRRVAVLYAPQQYFRCRGCHNLAYASQNEGFMDRISRKRRQIREKLGASMNLFLPVIIKPKGMHQNTFNRLQGNEQYYEWKWCRCLQRR